MKAFLKNYRQSPRKVRLVASLIKGKLVSIATRELSFLPKRASLPIKKLIESAIANAKHNFGVDKENLIVKDIRVDGGIVMKRFMPRAFGRAAQILKRTSHVSVTLAVQEPPKSEARSTKSETKSKIKSIEKKKV